MCRFFLVISGTPSNPEAQPPPPRTSTAATKTPDRRGDHLHQNGAKWCKLMQMVQSGAKLCKRCKMMQGGAKWCKMVQSGANGAK